MAQASHLLPNSAPQMLEGRRMVGWPPYSLSEFDFSGGDAPASLKTDLLAGWPVLARPVSVTGLAEDATGVYLWPIRRVMSKMWLVAMSCLFVEKGITEFEHPRASQEEVLETAAALRKLAARWPFGDQGAAPLVAQAERLESRFVLRTHFRKPKWPQGVARQDQLRTSMAFWGLQELRRALPELGFEAPTLARYAVDAFEFGALLSGEHRDLMNKATAEESLKRRIWQFARRLQPGHEPAVMAWLLNDVLAFGEDDCGRQFVDCLVMRIHPNR